MKKKCSNENSIEVKNETVLLYKPPKNIAYTERLKRRKYGTMAAIHQCIMGIITKIYSRGI